MLSHQEFSALATKQEKAAYISRAMIELGRSREIARLMSVRIPAATDDGHGSSPAEAPAYVGPYRAYVYPVRR